MAAREAAASSHSVYTCSVSASAAASARPAGRAGREQGHSGQKHRQGRILLLLLIIAIGLAVALSIYQKQSKEICRLQLESDSLNEDLAKAQREGKKLAELKDMSGSKEYIEQVARDELGLVRPDEIIFIHP